MPNPLSIPIALSLISIIFNISAMSFGSLSKNAIMALNGGAKLGGFAHNTGEGGLSPYHLEPGGDVIWQIGTGYFGCRNNDGTFNPTAFAERSVLPTVKMIEIKLSQGAKPGHGGILPASKVMAAFLLLESFVLKSPPANIHIFLFLMAMELAPVLSLP